MVSILLLICMDVGSIGWQSSVDTFACRSSIHFPLRSTVPCEVTYFSWLIRILLRVMLLLWNSTALMNFPSPSPHLTLSFSLRRIFSIFPASVATSLVITQLEYRHGESIMATLDSDIRGLSEFLLYEDNSDKFNPVSKYWTKLILTEAHDGLSEFSRELGNNIFQTEL